MQKLSGMAAQLLGSDADAPAETAAPRAGRMRRAYSCCMLCARFCRKTPARKSRTPNAFSLWRV